MYSLDMKNKDYFSRVKELESLAETELLRNECIVENVLKNEMRDWGRKVVENGNNDSMKVLVGKGGNVENWSQIVRIEILPGGMGSSMRNKEGRK